MQKITTPKIYLYLTALTLSIALTGCATQSPRTGWIKKDEINNIGVYVFPDGSRYAGQFSGNNFHGYGQFIYEYDYYGNFPSSYDAPQLSGGTLIGKFVDNALVEEAVVYTTRVSAKDNAVSDKEFKYMGGFKKGFKGKGIVTLRDGTVIKGIFDNEPTLYYVVPGEKPIFKTSSIIGSYFEGPVSITWKNGSKFEGISYRYYLFDRGDGMYHPKHGSDRCTTSYFFGKGTLKSPGKKDYTGLINGVTEDGLPKKASEEDLIKYLKEVAECPTILEDTRRYLINAQASYDAEMRQGRENARASLARELLNMPNKIRSDMAGVGAASRGTTVELEREKARRNIEFNELRVKGERNNKSSEMSKAASTPRTSTDDFNKEKTNQNNKSNNERLKSEKSSRTGNGSSSKNNNEPLIILKSTTHDVKPQIPMEKITMPDTSEKLVIPSVDKDYLTTKSNSTRPRTGKVMER